MMSVVHLDDVVVVVFDSDCRQRWWWRRRVAVHIRLWRVRIAMTVARQPNHLILFRDSD